MEKSFKEFVGEAKGRIGEITVEALKAKRAAGEALEVVDVREDSEWGAGRVTGAIHLGRGVLERDARKVLPNLSSPIVVYCGGGSRSALAADTLQAMGYSNVLSLDTGFRGWVDSGGEVDRSPAA